MSRKTHMFNRAVVSRMEWKSDLMTYFLPSGYRERLDAASYFDAPGHLVYQPHVYDLAAYLAERSGARYIVDIGCGSGAKLRAASQKFQIIGIDGPHCLPLSRTNLPQAQLLEADLEKGVPELDPGILKDAVVICADVVEHLRSPDGLLADLARISAQCRFVLVSTLDRDRARGIGSLGPPANPAHVREWTASEFHRLLCATGFRQPFFLGHTVNTDFHALKSTLLAISGREASYQRPRRDVRVGAIVNVYNEEDMLPEVIRHLKQQRVSVHIVDNWSNDHSYEIAQRAQQSGEVSSLRRFPAAPTAEYAWRRLLENSVRLSTELDLDWVLHYDADEIRVSPWNGVTLTEAIGFADSLGYDAIDFTVIDFRFLKSCPAASPPYEHGLTHFQFGRRPGHFAQIKAWKQRGQVVDLWSSGGHSAAFEGRRVYPLKFLTKHYPLRTPQQARLKIFRDRLPRVGKERELHGWHTHYDRFAESSEIIGWSKSELLQWGRPTFDAEFLVERLSGIGIERESG